MQPEVRRLLSERVCGWTAAGLLALTYLIVVEADDTDEDIKEATGFSLLVNALDGRRFGEEGFEPPFDYISRQGGGLVEIFACVANDGFAFWFVLDGEVADEELNSLCDTFAPDLNAKGGK